jgi:hypothetical protein
MKPEYLYIAGIIDFITANYVSKTQSGIFNFANNYPYENLLQSIEGKREYIFILLWNLLSNADKHKESNEFLFSVFEEEGCLAFRFCNDTKPEHIEKIASIINKKELPDPRRGAWAIENCLELLKWKRSFIKGENQIEICIKTNITTQ